MYDYQLKSKLSVFSHSLGDHSIHDLISKLRAASISGLRAIEISTIDLEHHSVKNSISLLEAAQSVGELCTILKLKVICLQPVRDVVEAKTSEESVNGITRWFPIMDALGTDLMLCCSSSLSPELISSNFSDAVRNLRAMGLAAGAKGESRLKTGVSGSGRPKKIAFEALCWGTFINTWSQAWEVVKAVDLENVGICLDSFNTLAREWADPTNEDGIQPGVNLQVKESLKNLSGSVPGSKIFLLQLADGKKLKEPIPEGTFETPALMTWSRSSRLFPMEIDRGGYLPVRDFVKAVLRTGYDGYWSAEVFNKTLFEEDPSVPESHAIRAIEGLVRLRSSLSRKKYLVPHHRLINCSHIKSSNSSSEAVSSTAGLLPISS